MGRYLKTTIRRVVRLTILLCVVCLPLKVFANIPVDANLYIFTVDTSIRDASAPSFYRLPIPNENYQLYWEKVGNEASINSAGAVHVTRANHTLDFGLSGIFRIAIDSESVILGRNDFDRFLINDSGDKAKFLMIEQWGITAWSSMESSFQGASAFIGSIATDTPDLSNVTSMRYMFSDTPMFMEVVGMGEWNTSSITSMYSIFKRASSANPDMSKWDTSSVTDMGYMFDKALVANPDTRHWDTSSVTHMDNMFHGATSAKPDTSQWDTSSVTDMGHMFDAATSANPDTRGWSTASVMYMDYMFRGATSAIPNTSGWDTSLVIDMSRMFSGATLVDPDTSDWDTSSVIDMGSMFESATSADPDTSGWDTSEVVKANSMFKNATRFSGTIDHLDMGNVTSAIEMFEGIRLSIADYDALLNRLNLQTIQSSVQFSAGKSTYCEAETARNNLITMQGWVINDGGLDCTAPTSTELLEDTSAAAGAHLDLDSDNDGLSDIQEGSADSDGDGVPDYLDMDSDNDGVKDSIEMELSVVNDGELTTSASLPRDTDGDGIADYRDGDSDNDGLFDVAESYGQSVDVNGDGQWDNFIDENNNGFSDDLEFNPLHIADTDEDGVIDQLDFDSDADGLSDLFENGGTDIDNNGVLDNLIDTNDDGIDDGYTAFPLTLPDTDRDGLSDYLDTDSDNDGVSDLTESGGEDLDADGLADNLTSPATVSDSDGDGIPNHLQSASAEANPVSSGSSGCSVDGTGWTSKSDPLLPSFVIVALSWLFLRRDATLKISKEGIHGHG